MSGLWTVPRAALLLAGVAAATLTRMVKTSNDAEQIAQLKKSVAELQSRHESRLQQLEMMVADHAQRLNEVPSTTEIISAMEALLAKTMTSLDERLSAQAHSIEVLKTTVSQTDELLERVLESIDNLRQPENEPALIG
jgi:DNA repair exonuclease SbcCD ATPase subunit